MGPMWGLCKNTIKNTCAHPLTNTFLKHLLPVIQYLVFLGHSLPAFWVIVSQQVLIWSFYFMFSCKNAFNLLNYQISWAQPLSCHSTGFLTEFRLWLWLNLCRMLGFFRSHSCVGFELYFRSLLCWNLKFLYITICLTKACRFVFFKIDLGLNLNHEFLHLDLSFNPSPRDAAL